ncbi:NUMOD4 motif-containing HNH endonuclease [Dietzia maris]|uniref:NUMOD4 motif-containing HNH endonuclease n=1 Tax=Dietzia maris TaxID=37915 RepID=UPI0037C6F822
MAERWKPIPGYEGHYEVSDAGQVRSLDRVITRSNGAPYPTRGRVLSPSDAHPSGHLYVHLMAGGDCTRQVHRLVMAAFAGPCPEGMEVRHLNGDPTDNRLTNLAYGTRSENARDQVAHGVHNRASQVVCKNGHEFTPENTYVNGSSRVCIECRRAYKRKWRAKRQLAGLPTK